MKVMLGILLCLLAIICGLYVGVWVFFIGGICQVINAIKATPPIDSLNLSVGLIRMIASIFCGIIAYLAMFSPGITLIFKRRSSSYSCRSSGSHFTFKS